MFWEKKKTVLEKIISEKGIDTAASQIAPLVNKKINSIKVAKQFVLEELDAARQGNPQAQHFAKESGYDEDEYIGAFNYSFYDVDGANGPQQLLYVLLTPQLQHNMDLMIELRTNIVDRIMKHWGLGKYQNNANDVIDIFSFDNSDQVLSAPKGQSQLITVLGTLQDIMKKQMWHVKKIDYSSKHPDGILFAIVGQSYLKFNGPDIRIAREIEASECTLGIIDNDLDVLPTVLLQLSFNFYQTDIQVDLKLFDSRNYGGYSAIREFNSIISFTRDELLGSFAHLNPESHFEQVLDGCPLFESELIYSNTFQGGPIDLENHLEDVMREVMQIALRRAMNL